LAGNATLLIEEGQQHLSGGAKVAGYKDFIGKQITAPVLDWTAKYEHFDAAVAAAFEWVQTNNIKVINFETVIIPKNNKWGAAKDEELDNETSLFMGTVQHQFVRVWYW
jgi:hypothetical protein